MRLIKKHLCSPPNHQRIGKDRSALVMFDWKWDVIARSVRSIVHGDFHALILSLQIARSFVGSHVATKTRSRVLSHTQSGAGPAGPSARGPCLIGEFRYRQPPMKVLSFNELKRRKERNRMTAIRRARRSPEAAAAEQRRASLVGDGAKWRITNFKQVARAMSKWA